MRVVVLGGCGEEGLKAAEELNSSEEVSQVIIADANAEKAKSVARELGGKAVARYINVTDTEKLIELVRGNDVVANFVGPYYKFGVSTVRAVIEAGVNYVDIMDDYDSTQTILDDKELVELAKSKGITAILGLGVSPGLTNVFGKYAAVELDEVGEIHTSWACTTTSGVLSPALTCHMLHITSGRVPTYQDGEWVYVKPLVDGEEIVEFPRLGKVKVYHVGHGEPVAIPRYTRGVRSVCNKFGGVPEEMVQVYRTFNNLQLSSEEPIPVKDVLIKPIDFVYSYFRHLPYEVAVDVFKAEEVEPVFACRVKVSGSKEGEKTSIEYNFATEDPSPSIYLPAVTGALMLGRGEIDKKGVFAPGGCIDPEPFIKSVAERGIVWSKSTEKE